MSFKPFLTQVTTLLSVEVNKSDNTLRVVYSDDHVTEVTADWLYKRRLTEEGKEERKELIKIRKPVIWGDNHRVKKQSYDKVTAMGSGFIEFGETLAKDGIFVITDTPDRLVFNEFVEKTGLPVQFSHYGDSWVVENSPTPTNHAYTAVELELHVDQPYLDSCLDIQYLHCMAQADEGGESVMSDGLKAAQILRQRYPEHYNTLTTVCIEYEDVIGHSTHGSKNYMASNTPVILLDREGEPEFLRINLLCRSSFFNGPVEDWEKLFPALKELMKILQQCSVVFKNMPGDIMVFDNQRILHGRQSYVSTQRRRLEGWYSNWDSLLSQLRVHKIKNMSKLID